MTLTRISAVTGLKSPVTRLVVRALLAGLVVIVTTLQTSDDPTSKSVLLGAIVAGFWAAAETLTPLNRSVGVGSPDQ